MARAAVQRGFSRVVAEAEGRRAGRGQVLGQVRASVGHGEVFGGRVGGGAGVVVGLLLVAPGAAEAVGRAGADPRPAWALAVVG